MRGSDDNKHVKFTYSVDGGSNYLSSNYSICWYWQRRWWDNF